MVIKNQSQSEGCRTRELLGGGECKYIYIFLLLLFFGCFFYFIIFFINKRNFLLLLLLLFLVKVEYKISYRQNKMRKTKINKQNRIGNTWVSSLEELSLTSSARRNSVTNQYTQGSQEQSPQ